MYIKKRGYTMRFVISCKAKDLKAEITKAWVKASK